MRLILVRHGESVWNVERRLQGQTPDVPLTEAGRAQAAAAAEQVAVLCDTRPVLVYSSDQLRAVETAQRIAAALGVRVHTTPLAREQGLGSLEGRRHDELVAEAPPPGIDVSEVRWGGGESVRDVHDRCARLLTELRGAADGRDIVLVSHGDLLRVLLAVLAGRGHRDVDWMSIANGEVLVREI